MQVGGEILLLSPSDTPVYAADLIKKLIRIICVIHLSFFFSSPDPKGHVSYCHHLASVVRRKLFQKSSPLKVLDQWKPNLV